MLKFLQYYMLGFLKYLLCVLITCVFITILFLLSYYNLAPYFILGGLILTIAAVLYIVFFKS